MNNGKVQGVTHYNSKLITREIVDKYAEDIAVDGSLIKKELGLCPIMI